MKSGASDPFSEDSEDERSESSEKSSGERSDPRDSADSEDERSESSESRTESEASRERGESEDERSESSENQASRAEPTDENSAPRNDADADPAVEGGSESERGADAAEDDGPLSREELPLVLRRDRVKDERPEVHQLFVQQGTHDRAVEAERTLEDRMDVDLSRTDAREAIYLAGMAHLDDAEEILRTWGYDL